VLAFSVLVSFQVLSTSSFAFPRGIRFTDHLRYTSGIQQRQSTTSSIEVPGFKLVHPLPSTLRPHPLFTKKEESTEKSGVEPKYLVALGVLIFAALYDFFVTHNGMKDGWVI
jgi:hypothetical protein